MKKVVCVLLTLVRCIVIFSAILLMVEVIYFYTVGDYLIYYDLMLRAAKNAAEQIYVIHQVYNVRHDWVAHYFSNYFIPGIRCVSMIISSYDVVCALYGNKKRIMMCITEIVATLVIIFITLLC